MKTIIWLEDNPDSIEEYIEEIKEIYDNKLNIQIWDGIYKNDERGLTCIEDFKYKIVKAIENKSRIGEFIGAFILDVRITVDDLSQLGFPQIKTEKGLKSGIQIARYYLRNEQGDSPLKDEFKDTPILFFTVAGGIADKFPWVRDEKQKYFFAEKRIEEDFDDIKKWLKQFT